MRIVHYIVPILLLFSTSGCLLGASNFSGIYRVNGKDATLTHMTVMSSGCFHDGIGFVLSEKEIKLKADEKFSDVGFNVQMGAYGDAIAVQVCTHGEAWRVDHSNFSHAGLKAAASTWVDQLRADGMSVTGGEYTGHVLTIKDARILDQPIEVDLKFRAKP